MKKARTWGPALGVLLFVATAAAAFAQTNTDALKCVGLYSETAAGYVSYRTDGGEWAVVKLGDVLPANSEIRINVDRDWIELVPLNDPNAVYEITGSESGEVVKRVADLLAAKPRTVSFPELKGGNPDPKFAEKLVVTQYLGRQIYSPRAGARERDIKYGDVLERTGKVTIIAINTTVTLMNSSGKVVTVIGPLKFDVEKVLTNQQLYKFLNVPR